MTLQLYRNTTIGLYLQEALSEIKHNYQLPDELCDTTLTRFDKVIAEAFNTKVKTKLNISGKLLSYRFCDNVWTLIMTGAEFNDGCTPIAVDKVKIVAIGSKSCPINNNGRQSSSIKTTSKRDRDDSDSGDDLRSKRRKF